VSLTLAINELATNATKYGALSPPAGKVEISRSVLNGAASSFNLSWREAGGPTVVKPTRFGFGSRVIKDFLARDFGGTVRLMHEPHGVLCELHSPLGNLPA
jgi:two-component sensor histidine kinase